MLCVDTGTPACGSDSQKRWPFLIRGLCVSCQHDFQPTPPPCCAQKSRTRTGSGCLPSTHMPGLAPVLGCLPKSFSSVAWLLVALAHWSQ